MSTPLKFCLRFILVFAVLVEAFEASRGTAFERIVIEDGILAPTVGLIHVLLPTAHIALRDRTLIWDTSQLHITRGCEGIELFLLLAAAVIAFPATAARRLRGLLAGFVLAYALTVARLVILDGTLRYAPGAWETMHGLVMPLAPVFALALYFLRWSGAGASAGAARLASRAA